MGVIQAPRVQLATGLSRTREKATSVPAATTIYPPAVAVSFNRVGQSAGAELAMTCYSRSIIAMAAAGARSLAPLMK
jgi:hypothetical protein